VEFVIPLAATLACYACRLIDMAVVVQDQDRSAPEMNQVTREGIEYGSGLSLFNMNAGVDDDEESRPTIERAGFSEKTESQSGPRRFIIVAMTLVMSCMLLVLFLTYGAFDETATSSLHSLSVDSRLEARSIEDKVDSTLCTTPACIDLASTILNNLSPSWQTVDPCTNFNEYVCGGWGDHHELRAEQSGKS
jgi:hypothetical protein